MAASALRSSSSALAPAPPSATPTLTPGRTRRPPTVAGRSTAARSRFVAGAVPEAVVDPLEVVEVEHEHGDLALRVAAAGRERVGEAVDEQQAVRQPGEPVVEGLALQRGAAPGHARGHRVEGLGDRAELVAGVHLQASHGLALADPPGGVGEAAQRAPDALPQPRRACSSANSSETTRTANRTASWTRCPRCARSASRAISSSPRSAIRLVRRSAARTPA